MRATTRGALLAAAAFLYVAWHAASLTRSPVPYFDDTFFASLGESYLRTGELTLAVGPLWMPEPVLLYGPLYFRMQRFVFAHLGFGIFQHRLLGLVFGLAMVPLVFAALRNAGVRRDTATVACVLLALDPTLVLTLHGGRMDAVALFFVLAAFVLLQRAWRAGGGTGLLFCAAAGSAAAVAVLTTPRPAYLVVLLGMILVARWALTPTKARAGEVVAFALPLLGLYALWVASAFGGIGALLAYYGRHADKYVTWSVSVRPVHYPLLAVLAAIAAFRVAAARPVRFDALVVFALAGIAAFYVLGINPPRFGTAYAIFTIPLAYLALASLAESAESARILGVRGERLRRIAFALLLVVNGAACAARMAIEASQWHARDPAPFERLVQTTIPPGSHVIGDDKFYYAVVRAGSDYQYWKRGGTVDERAAYHTERWDFDYLVTNEPAGSPLFAAYATRVSLVPVATFTSGEPSALATWLSGIACAFRVGAPLVGDYTSTIFARADRGPRQS